MQRFLAGVQGGDQQIASQMCIRDRVRPLKDGVIADFDITANMLETFLKKACGNSMFSRPRVVICIPSGVTEVERRAVREAALKAGARQVSVIEEPMAAAIGAGPVSYTHLSVVPHQAAHRAEDGPGELVIKPGADPRTVRHVFIITSY